MTQPVYEISRTRLNYSTAWIKQMSDGTEVLQSYATNVVRKNLDGTYTRLWHDWSTTTNKHVHAWCGKTFRDIPFEDGTVEDRKPEYKRPGIDLHGTKKHLTPNECKYDARWLADKIKSGEAAILGYYNTCLDKDLKKIWNRDQRMRDLVDILSMCAKRKIKGHHMVNSLIKMCDYNIEALWEIGLKTSYPDVKL